MRNDGFSRGVFFVDWKLHFVQIHTFNVTNFNLPDETTTKSHNKTDETDLEQMKNSLLVMWHTVLLKINNIKIIRIKAPTRML